MKNIIMRFLAEILEMVCVLLIAAGGFIGLGQALEANGIDIPTAIITVPLGIIGGFVVATIFLGIPFLLLRINKNLEDIKEILLQK